MHLKFLHQNNWKKYKKYCKWKQIYSFKKKVNEISTKTVLWMKNIFSKNPRNSIMSYHYFYKQQSLADVHLIIPNEHFDFKIS